MSKAKKKNGCNPLAAVLVAGILGIVLLVALLFGAKVYLMSWIQSDAFRDWASRQIASRLHADVRIEDLSWEGLRAKIGKISARGFAGAAFSKAEFHALRIDVAGVVNQAVSIPEINASQGSIEFSKDRLNAPAVAILESDSPPPLKIPSFLAPYVPKRVVIDNIVIGNSFLTVKDDQGAETVLVRNSRIRIQPDLEKAQAVFHTEGGDLRIATGPEMKINQGQLRWQDNSLFITSASLGIYDGGHIEVKSGEIAFSPASSIDLKADLSRIDVKKVLSDEWQKRISGTLRGPVTVAGTSSAPLYKGTLYLDNGELSGIPALERVAKYTGSPRFNNMKLSQAESDFSQTGDKLELRNIRIHSPGVAKIEGQLDKDGEALRGTLQVGITPGILRFIASTEKKVFTEERDNMLWTTVNIGGTTSQMTEDLSARLIAAVIPDILTKLPDSVQDRIKAVAGIGEGDAALDTAGGTIAGPLLDRLRQAIGQQPAAPTAPPNPNPAPATNLDRAINAIETGKKLIDIFSPGIKGN